MATGLLSYHVLIEYTTLGAWRYAPWLVALEYAPVYLLLMLGWLRLRASKHEREHSGGQ